MKRFSKLNIQEHGMLNERHTQSHKVTGMIIN